MVFRIFLKVLTLNLNGQKQAGGGNRDYEKNIAIDNSGNSYVTGTFSGTATFGSIALTSAGGYDIYVAKLDANGNFLWAKQVGGSSVNLGQSITVYGNGNSYAMGSF